MTIATEITRLQTAKADLKTAINAKGGTITDGLIDTYAAQVAAISVGVDTSDATATSGDILDGKTAYVGEHKITGSIVDITNLQSELGIHFEPETGIVTGSKYVPAGYLDTAINDYESYQVSTKAAQTYTPGTEDQAVAAGDYLIGDQTILGDANLIADNIKSGVSIFGVAGTHVGGASVTAGVIVNDGGTLKVQKLSFSGTTPSDDGAATTLSTAKLFNTGRSEPAYSGAGLDTSDATATVGDILSGKTAYVNGTKLTGTMANASDATASGLVVTVPAGYKASSQTLTLTDANLVAGNVKKDVAIFGVTGSYEGTGGGGSTDFYKCATVDTATQTWTGYKAILSNGVYTYEATATTGLIYANIKPVVGKVYTDGALVAVAMLYQDIPTSGLVFSDMLTSTSGWSATPTGDPGYETDSTLGRIVFNTYDGNDAWTKLATTGLPSGSSARTMSCMFRQNSLDESGWCGFGYGVGGTTDSRFTWGVYSGYPVFTAWANDNMQTTAGKIPDLLWHRYTLTYDGTTVKHYTDGVFNWQWASTLNTPLNIVHIGDPWESYAPHGYYSDLRIWNRVLTDDELTSLIPY